MLPGPRFKGFFLALYCSTALQARFVILLCLLLLAPVTGFSDAKAGKESAPQEVSDNAANSLPTGYLRGLAAQGFIGTDNQVQFGAFTILGSPRKVLIRGLGPALDQYIPGAVHNPQIALSFNGAASPLR